MADGGVNNNDPFTNYLNLEVRDWIQLTLGSIFLLPVRALGVVLALLLAWLVAKIGLVGLTKDEAESVVVGRTGWRRKVSASHFRPNFISRGGPISPWRNSKNTFRVAVNCSLMTNLVQEQPL